MLVGGASRATVFVARVGVAALLVAGAGRAQAAEV
jgi:hypothetical protein